jgi:hypothetical protein
MPVSLQCDIENDSNAVEKYKNLEIKKFGSEKLWSSGKSKMAMAWLQSWWYCCGR